MRTLYIASTFSKAEGLVLDRFFVTLDPAKGLLYLSEHFRFDGFQKYSVSFQIFVSIVQVYAKRLLDFELVVVESKDGFEARKVVMKQMGRFY